VVNDAARPGGLAEPLAWAIELPDDEPPVDPYYDIWLIVAAVVYPIVGFGVLPLVSLGLWFWLVLLPPFVISVAPLFALGQGVPRRVRHRLPRVGLADGGGAVPGLGVGCRVRVVPLCRRHTFSHPARIAF
jgi:hypothetical protein